MVDQKDMSMPIHSEPPASVGKAISTTSARGARRVGLIWVLAISTVLAALALLGYSTLNSRHMNTSSQASGANAKSAADSFNATSGQGVKTQPQP
jgi:hypothetical protein